MATVLHREQGGKAERELEAGRVLGLLLRRKGVVLLAALLLMILAGLSGRDAGDKLTSGAYLDPSAESQRAAELLAPWAQLAAEIRDARPDVAVLFTSGYTDDQVVRHGVRDAGVAFIPKPWTPALLAARVREVLDDARRQTPPDADPARE